MVAVRYVLRLLAFLFFLPPIAVAGQEFTQLRSQDPVLEQPRGWKISNVRCDFAQEKRTQLLKAPQISTGVFYFREDGCVRFDYQEPQPITIIVSPTHFYMRTAQQQIAYPLGNRAKGKGNPLFSELQQLMGAALKGEYDRLKPSYNIDYKLVGEDCYMRFSPKGARAKGFIEAITLQLNLPKQRVMGITISQPRGESLCYSFSNHAERIELPDALFAAPKQKL